MRPEPFGALAYHYGTRRLVFLRPADVARVVAGLGDHDTVADALSACGIAPHRWAAFATAVQSLADSGLLVDRAAGSAR